jgi:hypothetical protein
LKRLLAIAPICVIATTAARPANVPRLRYSLLFSAMRASSIHVKRIDSAIYFICGKATIFYQAVCFGILSYVHNISYGRNLVSHPCKPLGLCGTLIWLTLI